MLDELLDQRVLDARIPAIGYIRVSLAREDMISPELQRKAIEEWAKRTGHRIIDWVEDLDKTGRNFKRKIMRVIERIEAGEARAIAVWKYSRFGRTREGVALNLGRVERAGAQLLSATEGIDTSSATGRLQRGVIMEFNSYESDRAGEQWIETHKWRREHGLPASGRRRFGYIWHPRKVTSPDGAVRLQAERYEPDPQTAKLIPELYQRYIAGEGFKQLAIWLNDQAAHTVRGQLWSNATLLGYMDSGFAAGYLRIHDPSCKEPYRSECPNHLFVKHPEFHHPEIISEEVWKLYRERRTQVRALAPRARKATYPLSGLARCGLCKASARRKTTSRYAYFTCNTRKCKGPKACPGTSVSIVKAEAGVREWLATVAGEVEAAAQRSAAGLDGSRVDQNARIVSELEAQEGRLARAVAKHMRTYALAGDEDDQDGSFERAYLNTLRELRDEKLKVSQALSAARREAAGGQSEVAMQRAAAEPVIIGLLQEWDALEPERINVLLRRVLRHLVVMPGGEVVPVPVWAVEEALAL